MGTGSEHQQPKPDQNPSSRGACPLFPQPDCPPRIQWEHTPVDISLEDAFDLRETHADRRDAVQWLQAALAPGPTPATDVLEQAEANGITPRSARTAPSRRRRIPLPQRLRPRQHLVLGPQQSTSSNPSPPTTALYGRPQPTPDHQHRLRGQPRNQPPKRPPHYMKPSTPNEPPYS